MATAYSELLLSDSTFKAANEHYPIHGCQQ